MTTLLLTLALDPERTEDVVERLRTELAPWLRRRPGFVTSRWLLADQQDRCTVVVEVGCGADLDHLLAAVRATHTNPARSWHCERVEAVQDLHLAERPPVGL
ncbi:hypothetical protein [Nocardioides sp. SYSU DS0651]|uniref:hypothetical protein n=1 Tax=Nocardioides sp. SYSU DS0651 TaxID=3415955 RepID=UPI003F4B335F